MILVEKILGNLAGTETNGRTVDVLDLDWFDTGKTTLRKKTRAGQEVGIRKDTTPLEDGDLLYLDQERAIAVNILPCECIVFKPQNFREMGTICFEIGNKHIPIFINEEAEVSVEFENPLYRLLEKYGYQPRREVRKLLKTHALTVRRHENKYNRVITIK
ncbi:urease accessory protein UreE [Rufibacter glacialis]|uniref:Urease accessory protein UreE n=1 Tax=Rufibacter glacialis TaxID=1259555 RepID=A0A5M8QEK8_9BACT|nr:urease accessory protein UreE [Rufibacter glacialis]KAA6434439.1 urease accessory protein UreE [Rufibacter glacialis]GGK69597.1 urease accessory protein UreE [Rufibacter glacialis]